MNTDQLIAQGNFFREQNQPEQSLACYAQAFVLDHRCEHAWNNYGNVIREMGYPDRAIPFLQQAVALNPNNVTAQFNLAVSYLLLGDYATGWSAYESRWNYEHLSGTIPQFTQPRWTGQSLDGKRILISGEQGHGDNIQFVRFAYNLWALGAEIYIQVTDSVAPLLSASSMFKWIGGYNQTPPEFDYWVPIMSLPGVLGIRVDNIPQLVGYLGADLQLTQQWAKLLGPKHSMRIGISWSGRRDTWINRHKSVTFENIVKLIKNNPDNQWINLQADCTDNESHVLNSLGVCQYPGTIKTFADTAALMMNLDLVISVDTAVSHLSGALGRPTWIMLNNYAVDWRWLLNRHDSPWYSTVKLFRQPAFNDWASVTDKVSQYLKLFKI